MQYINVKKTRVEPLESNTIELKSIIQFGFLLAWNGGLGSYWWRERAENLDGVGIFLPSIQPRPCSGWKVSL